MVLTASQQLRRAVGALRPLPPTPGRLARVGAVLSALWVLAWYAADLAARAGGSGFATPPAGDGAGLAEQLASGFALAVLTVIGGGLIGWFAGLVILLARKLERQFYDRPAQR
jgi:hypothetical protein